MFKLSEGSLLSILKGETSAQTILQIVGHHSVTKGVIVEVSDGRYWTLAVLQASCLLDMMSAGQLRTHSVVDVQECASTVWTCAHDEKWHILELLALDVVEVPSGANVGCKKLGNPIPLLWPANGLKGLLDPMLDSGSSDWNDAKESTQRIFPIESLNPYSTKSVICARVLSKSFLRSWKKTGGQEGQLFSMVLADNTASIQVTVFDNVCPAFYELMEVNRVYFIQHFLVKTANNQYSKTLHSCELSLIEKSMVCEFVMQEQGLVNSGPASIAPLVFNFVPLHWLAFLPENSKIDLIGVCKRADEVKVYDTCKTKACTKRRVHIVDHTNIEVTLTLWGREAEKLLPHLQPVLAVMNGTVELYRGSKSVSVGMGSSLLVAPDLPEAELLQDLALHRGLLAQRAPNVGRGGLAAAGWMTVLEALSQRVEWFTCLATVLQMEARHCYKACARPHCRKRVIRKWNDTYRCHWCLVEAPTFKWCFPVRVIVADWTCSVVAEAVQREAQVLTGLSADERRRLLGNGSLRETFQKAQYKSHVFRLRCHWEEYKGKHLVRALVLSSRPVSARDYNRYLLSTLKKSQT